jgi:5-methylthioribose kinase
MESYPAGTSLTTFDAVLIKWVAPFMFSVVCMVLLMTVTLIVKISYSKTVRLTQLSLYPYYVILVYFFFEAIEIIMIFEEVDNLSDNTQTHFFSNIIWPMIGTCSIGKFVTFTLFVNSQVFEWYITYFFMNY